MTEKDNKEHGVNIEIDEGDTTLLPNDAFARAELTYPCDFPLSVVGENVPEYVKTITDIIKKHVPDLNEENIFTRTSNGDKYCSLRTNFVAQSREQLDDLYRELTAHPLVKFVL